jgi:hypothetical protein
MAETVYQKMTKNFGDSKRVWLDFAKFYFDTQQNPSRARDIFQNVRFSSLALSFYLPNFALQGLRRLPKRKHISFISEMARLEFKYGLTSFSKK